MKKVNLLLFLFFIALFSCNKKPVPLNIIGTPVFTFNGKINSNTVLLEAGNDSMYMYTNSSASTTIGKTLQGWFANQANANSEPNLLFELINYKPIGNNNTAIEIANIHNFYSFSLDSITTIDTTEEFTFIPNDTSKPSATYLWHFDDGTSSTQKTPKKTFANGGVHTVTFLYNAGSGCQTDSISNSINFDKNSTCRPQFRTATTSVFDSITTHIINPNSTYNYTWVWAVGDSLHAGNADSSSHQYFDSLDHTILLIASDNNCSATFKANINPSGSNTCTAAFIYTSVLKTTSTSVSNDRKNTFIITWKNAGATYKSYKTSTTSNQNNQLILTTNSANLYNANNVSIDAQTNCWLYNTANNNDSIPIKSTKLIFALGF